MSDFPASVLTKRRSNCSGFRSSFGTVSPLAIAVLIRSVALLIQIIGEQKGHK
ncbi:MAG: hypothetical protein WA919_02790 [Coleofasciculaceae cyanobacterium]